jgi:putative tricarboxylic transport membrane protein
MGYERIGGVIWVILGMALGIGSLRLGFGNFQKPGPGFMPLLTGCLLALLGFFLTLLHVRRRPPDTRGKDTSLKPFWGKGAFSLAVSFLYVFLLDPLGFVLATFLLILFLLKIMGAKKWVIPILISVLTVVVSYFIFEVWLRINFPKGILRIG